MSIEEALPCSLPSSAPAPNPQGAHPNATFLWAPALLCTSRYLPFLDGLSGIYILFPGEKNKLPVKIIIN